MEQVVRIAAESRDQLLALPNVVGVAVGYKRRQGEVTREPSVVVLVRRKVALAELAAGDTVPRQVQGVPTDVVEVGDLKAQEAALVAPEEPGLRLRRLRPALPGLSVGHYRITAGTLGALVYDCVTGEPLILSNNHVLANSQTPRGKRAAPGDHILQPGPYDGGTERDTLALLYRFVPLRFPRPSKAGAPRAASPNLCDAAVAKPLSADLVDAAILGLGPVTGTTEPVLELPVKKSGRTTGCTAGQVTALHATVQVSYGPGKLATFSEQVVLTPMSEGGDSGSLIIDEEGRAVALLFAGSGSATIACPIATVLEALKVSLTPPSVPGGGK
jgi:hypothetical protein